jgi:hypothetical protein
VIDYGFGDVKSTGASYAHYTVREFLEGNRVTQSLASSFGICRESVIVDSLEATLITATTKPLQWDDSHFSMDVFEDDNSNEKGVLVCWSIYAALSAINGLYNLPLELVVQSSDRLWSLYQMLLQICIEFRDNLGHMSNLIWGIAGEKSFGCHDFLDIVQPTWQGDVSTFVQLLFSGESQENMILADWFLRSLTDYRSIFEQPTLFILEFVLHGSDYTSFQEYEFEGSILEIFAQLYQYFPEAFRFLLGKDMGTGNPTALLLSHLGVHIFLPDYELCDQCPSLCTRLIDLGASVQGKGYLIAPLQIAVYTLDVDAVELLLGYGADPQGVGNPDGIRWGEKSVLNRYNVLEGKSPLECLLVPSSYTESAQIDGQVRWRLATILLRWGAKLGAETCRITLLQAAASALEFEVVKLLLASGANPNGIGNPTGTPVLGCYKSLAGKSPLACCLQAMEEFPDEEGKMAMIKLLEEHGAVKVWADNGEDEDSSKTSDDDEVASLNELADEGSELGGSKTSNSVRPSKRRRY